MQNIRRATKKHRTLLTVIVILLMVGVVGSFAVWDTSAYQNETGQQTITYAQQAEALRAYVDSFEPENIADAEYLDALELARAYSAMYQSYVYAGLEDVDDAEEDYTALADDAIANSIAYYGQALNVLPSGAEADAEAEIYAEMSSAQMVAGDIEAAAATLDTAVGLAPYNATVACVNAQYIYYYDENGSFEAAETYLNDVLDNMQPGTDDYVTVANQLSSITATEQELQALLEQLQNMQTDTSESGDTTDTADTTETTGEEDE